ncbi:hypothetical protein I316_03413 [Kwoniella heveanensis BCC8398]|uniref:AMP-dependent synthetase/ligase domain-containing protein n=1 Tax=Kwoniella heveanensis BCC8398 TaxID=1296120 RepID=A0A1B9GV12_9TREE|nr:hypothetical protein I316_03413 [Kwoniella heveanensis BCC8398]
MPDIEIDNLTVLLLTLLAGLLIYHRFFSTPQPLVHPLLLGKQSEVSTVRKKNETGIYRSWATGQNAPLTVRPANSVKIVHDVVTGPKASKSTSQRYILDTPLSDEALIEIIRLLPIGIELLFPHTASATKTSQAPILTLLPPSPTSALPLLLLSLSAAPNKPLVILPTPRLLTPALRGTGHPAPAIVVIHVNLLDDVVEQVAEDCQGPVGILVIGDPQRTGAGLAKSAQNRGISIKWWEDIWEIAESRDASKVKTQEAHYEDVHSYYYAEGKEDERPIVVKATHLNMTAGIASLLSLFPADKRPSAALHDTVASAVPLNTPLGMTIALASVWTGAGFRMIGNHEPLWDPEEVDHAAELEILADPKKNLPKPTIMFISPKHHHALVERLQYTYTAHPFAAVAARHKNHSIRAGHIDRDSLWDRVLWSGMRENVLGGIAGQRLRGVILVGDAPPPNALGASHLLLSLPLTRLHPSLYTAGPVFVTHFYDLQSPGVSHILKEVNLWKSADKVHSGPPASNVEVFLKGDKVEDGHTNDQGGEAKAIHGGIWIRGPSVLERVDGGGNVSDGWVDIGEHAKVQTNGTFIVDPPSL